MRTIKYFSIIFALVFSKVSFSESQLNGTGIDWYGEFPKGVSTDCNLNTEDAKIHHAKQQDCGNQLAQTDPLVKIETNTESRVFNFSKLDASGEVLSNDALTWSCVKDNRSGLIWEVKQNDKSMHDSTDKFTWYSSDRKRNGGHIGDWNNNGNHCAGYEPTKPRSYCHTEQFVDRVNKKGLCGLTQWRLPSQLELSNIVHFGETQPAIDTRFFPNTQKGFYWTASPVTHRMKTAWAISFEYGFLTTMPRSETKFIRLVHSGKTKTEEAAQ